MNALVAHTRQHQVISLSNDAFNFLRVHGFDKMQRFKVKVNGKEGNDLCQAVQDLMNKGAVDARVQDILNAIDYFDVSEEVAFQGLRVPEDQWDMYRALVEQARVERARVEQEDT